MPLSTLPTSSVIPGAVPESVPSAIPATPTRPIPAYTPIPKVPAGKPYKFKPGTGPLLPLILTDLFIGEMQRQMKMHEDTEMQTQLESAMKPDIQRRRGQAINCFTSFISIHESYSVMHPIDSHIQDFVVETSDNSPRTYVKKYSRKNSS